MNKYFVIEGFGDFDTPSNCWDIRLVDTFDTEEEAIEVSANVWEDYVGGNEWKSFFVLVREEHELAGFFPTK